MIHIDQRQRYPKNHIWTQIIPTDVSMRKKSSPSEFHDKPFLLIQLNF